MSSIPTPCMQILPLATPERSFLGGMVPKVGTRLACIHRHTILCQVPGIDEGNTDNLIVEILVLNVGRRASIFLAKRLATDRFVLWTCLLAHRSRKWGKTVTTEAGRSLPADSRTLVTTSTSDRFFRCMVYAVIAYRLKNGRTVKFKGKSVAGMCSHVENRCLSGTGCVTPACIE